MRRPAGVAGNQIFAPAAAGAAGSPPGWLAGLLAGRLGQTARVLRGHGSAGEALGGALIRLVVAFGVRTQQRPFQARSHAGRCLPRLCGAVGMRNSIGSTVSLTLPSADTKQTVSTIGSEVTGRRRFSNRSKRCERFLVLIYVLAGARPTSFPIRRRFQRTQSRLDVLRLHDPPPRFEQCREFVRLLDGDLTAGQSLKDRFGTLGQFLRRVHRQRSGFYRRIFAPRQDVTQQRAQQWGVSFHGLHQRLAYHGFGMAVQQFLGGEAFLVAATARTPTAELVAGLERPSLFDHRDSVPRSARRPSAAPLPVLPARSAAPKRIDYAAFSSVSAPRSAAISAKVRPSPSRCACSPLKACHRVTATSIYLGSNSMPQQTRFVASAAANVVPDPRKGSYTNSPRLVWFRMGRCINSIGFCVGWSYLSSPEPPMMNLGEGESHTVEFSPALPYQGAFFFRTYQHGSC